MDNSVVGRQPVRLLGRPPRPSLSWRLNRLTSMFSLRLNLSMSFEATPDGGSASGDKAVDELGQLDGPVALDAVAGAGDVLQPGGGLAGQELFLGVVGDH